MSMIRTVAKTTRACSACIGRQPDCGRKVEAEESRLSPRIGLDNDQSVQERGARRTGQIPPTIAAHRLLLHHASVTSTTESRQPAVRAVRAGGR